MGFIYTAFKLLAKAIQNPEFEKRDIDGLTTGKLEMLNYVGIPIYRQIAYTNYIATLPAFLHACDVQCRVSTKASYYKLKCPSANFPPFTLPPLMVSSRTVLKKTEDKENFKSSLKHPSETVRGPSGDAYVLRNITPKTLATLPITTINQNTPSTADSTSLIGMASIFTTLQILTLFLAVHSYPAFQTEDTETSRYNDEAELHFVNSGTTATSLYRGDPETYTEKGITELNWSDKAPVSDDVKKISTAAKTIGMTLKNTVLVAKPAPFFPEINYGPPTSVPNLPGYVFPYFNGLIMPSKETILSVMKRFFFNGFGNSAATATAAFQEWCKGVDKWYTTAFGKEIAHVLFVLQLCLESQGKIFLIMQNGVYMGSVILGYGFSLFADGTLSVPSTASELQKLVRGLDAHSEAIREIVELLQGLEFKGGMDTSEENSLTITSTRQLFHEINRREKLSDERLETLVDLVSRVTFEEKFWPITVDKIVLWLQCMVDDDQEIMDAWPMYLGEQNLYDMSRAHQILSAFGPTAPSLIDGGGKAIPIPKGLTAEDPISIIDPVSGEMPMQSIYISAKKIHVAVQDAQGMVKKRVVRQNLQERAAGHRTIRFRGESRKQIWNALKVLPFEVEKEDKGKKRARDGEDNEEEDRKKKKGKATEATAAFDLSIFA